MGADLGAEPVLQRGDDPAAVGVVLGVGRGHQQHVERQPQRVAADLDVALLHHVQQRDLDALGEVGQLVDRDDAAVRPRDQAEVDGLRVAEAAALGDLHRVDVADQVADGRCPGWRASRRTAQTRCRQATGRSSPSSAARRRDAGVIGSSGCSPQLGALDHRGPLVEQADQGAQQPGLALAALAEQYDVVPGEQRALELREHGAVEADDAGPRVAPRAQRREQVVADLGLDAARQVAGGTQFARRAGQVLGHADDATHRNLTRRRGATPAPAAPSGARRPFFRSSGPLSRSVQHNAGRYERLC